MTSIKWSLVFHMHFLIQIMQSAKYGERHNIKHYNLHKCTWFTMHSLNRLIIISLKINLFSPWYSWKIAKLALNNNHSLYWTPSLAHIKHLLSIGSHLKIYIHRKSHYLYIRFQCAILYRAPSMYQTCLFFSITFPCHYTLNIK